MFCKYCGHTLKGVGQSCPACKKAQGAPVQMVGLEADLKETLAEQPDRMKNKSVSEISKDKENGRPEQSEGRIRKEENEQYKETEASKAGQMRLPQEWERRLEVLRTEQERERNKLRGMLAKEGRRGRFFRRVVLAGIGILLIFDIFLLILFLTDRGRIRQQDGIQNEQELGTDTGKQNGQEPVQSQGQEINKDGGPNTGSNADTNAAQENGTETRGSGLNTENDGETKWNPGADTEETGQNPFQNTEQGVQEPEETGAYRGDSAEDSQNLGEETSGNAVDAEDGTVENTARADDAGNTGAIRDAEGIGNTGNADGAGNTGAIRDAEDIRNTGSADGIGNMEGTRE